MYVYVCVCACICMYVCDGILVNLFFSSGDFIQMSAYQTTVT